MGKSNVFHMKHEKMVYEKLSSKNVTGPNLCNALFYEYRKNVSSNQNLSIKIYSGILNVISASCFSDYSDQLLF